MPNRFVFALALTIAGVLLVTESALAQRVLLVRPPASDDTLSEAFNRLRAELSLQDFEVVVMVAPPGGVSPEALEEGARKADAFAGVSLARDATGAMADVCIADRVTGKRSQRRLAVSGVDQAPRVLAVRAVDLLRSSLSELPPGERPPEDVVGVAPGVAPPELNAWSVPPPLWQLRVAPGVVDSAGFGPALGGSIALFVRPTTRFSAGVSFIGPLFGAEFVASVGSASIRQELALAQASYNLLPAGAFRLGPTLGLGVYHLEARGEVDEPLQATSGDMFGFAAVGGVEAGLELTRALSLTAALDMLLVTPEPVVAIDTHEMNAQNPLLLASVGLGVAF